MSWTTAGFPPPQNVYPMKDDAGLVRAPFSVGYRNQLQKWKNQWRVYGLEFIIDKSKLTTMEQFFWPSSAGGSNGFDWFNMPLISENRPPDSNGDPVDQLVRPISSPVFTAMGHRTYRVTFSVETWYYPGV